MISPFERRTLRRIIKLASQFGHTARPNPPAVAAILKGTTEIAIGRHRGPGTPHAEVDALRTAGTLAHGATMVVTLEPCTHWGANPPCIDAIISSGIRRVLFPILDPNPIVRAHPAKDQLEAAGIEVEYGALSDLASIANAEFLTHIATKRPFVTVKLAASLDGKIATSTGESQWISGPVAATYVQQMRHNCDAVMVGIGTALTDNPRLTDRSGKARSRPIRKVILDPRAELPLSARVFEDTVPNDVIVVISNTAPAERVLALQTKATVILIPHPTLRAQWNAILRPLYDLEIYHILLEGGTAVVTDAIDAGVVDQLTVIHGPILLGSSSFSMYSTAQTLSSAIKLHHVRYRRAGHDMITTGFINNPTHLIRSTHHP
ncbi:bifunctional diaminohydroxyphosphoribosylaminopyrimidine deaminase/5-amino-6-(5-phosphoribosylamino)uracil reductase RibD [bacterium]|nr:bifunctional diaminohydroxyphosphoribosylaminopyrimidine deaminase/5-amino-6-(5-phosphoribosylamino)uracil reductase RibD [bacterium]